MADMVKRVMADYGKPVEKNTFLKSNAVLYEMYKHRAPKRPASDHGNALQ